MSHPSLFWGLQSLSSPRKEEASLLTGRGFFLAPLSVASGDREEKEQMVCVVARMRYNTHHLLFFKWGGVVCQADAADRRKASTCEVAACCAGRKPFDLLLQNQG